MNLKPVAALAGALAALAAGALNAYAAEQPPGPSDFKQAIDEAYAIVVAAPPGDVDAAHEAEAILKAYTGNTQPEILADLYETPPDLQDAAMRLAALQRALANPATTSDPEGAAAKLHHVLSDPRYDALHRPPTLLERFGQWVQDRVRELIRFLFGGNSVGGVIPDWIVYLIGALIIAAVAFVVFRSAGGRLGGGVEAFLPGAPRPPADYFAEADRLAARGDRVGAIRALCAGVAGTLAGEKTWEGSPLTVREIFMRSPDPAALRPLLLPFEAAVYGGRDVDVAAYERALVAAAPFRTRLEAAA